MFNDKKKNDPEAEKQAKEAGSHTTGHEVEPEANDDTPEPSVFRDNLK